MILTTSFAHRDYYRAVLPPHAYRGVLPSSRTELVESAALAVIDAVRCAVEMGRRQGGHFVSPTYTPSKHAWDAGTDGARCELQWQTDEPGFYLGWTFEHVASARVLTAVAFGGLVEVYEADRFDQPVTFAESADDRPDRVLRSLGFERVSHWDNSSATVVCATVDADR